MKQLIPPSSGSVAGTVYSRNRYGQYIRTRAIPTNPATVFQTNARARMTTLSAAWRQLLPSQRDQWQAVAAEVTRTDSLGQSYSPTGQQWYIGVNTNNLLSGLPIASDAPAIVTPVAPIMTGVTLNDISISVSLTGNPAGGYTQIWASPGLSQGVSFFKAFKLLKTISRATTGAVVVTPEFRNRYGDPVEGQKVIFEANFLLDGQKGATATIEGTMTVAKARAGVKVTVLEN